MQKQAVKKRVNPGISVINKSKLVRVTIPRPWINQPWYFDVDGELSNSIITGIRLLTASLDYNPAGTTDLNLPQVSGFYLNMVDFHNEKLLNDCPVTTFAPLSSNQAQYKRPFTRVRLKVQMEKCYVINAQDPTFPDDGNVRYMYFQINYRPISI